MKFSVANSTRPKSLAPIWRGLFLCVSLFTFAFGGIVAARAAGLKDIPPTSLGPGSQFTIADFDGDRSPDSASISPGATSSGNARYSIQLQLSRKGPQSFQLFAPGGGLVIEARDVNGDNNVDLVLATAWLREPVAVFLNDGNGVFSRAESKTFPSAFREPASQWSASPDGLQFAIDAPPQAPGIEADGCTSLPRETVTGFVVFGRDGFKASPLLLSQPGRAPPSA